MGELGYGTRGPLVGKLKELLADIQTTYESFLDAQTLYQQGKLAEREFFAKSGEFLTALSSLTFLNVKVILELDAAIAKEDTSRKPGTFTTPSATFTPDMISKVSTPMYKPVETTDSKFCIQCNVKIPKGAKFCTKCGTPQS
ncbi:MAG: zinc ribbon domain-containing protein [Nitrososphaerales archaeon]